MHTALINQTRQNSFFSASELKYWFFNLQWQRSLVNRDGKSPCYLYLVDFRESFGFLCYLGAFLFRIVFYHFCCHVPCSSVVVCMKPHFFCHLPKLQLVLFATILSLRSSCACGFDYISVASVFSAGEHGPGTCPEHTASCSLPPVDERPVHGPNWVSVLHKFFILSCDILMPVLFFYWQCKFCQHMLLKAKVFKVWFQFQCPVV